MPAGVHADVSSVNLTTIRSSSGVSSVAVAVSLRTEGEPGDEEGVEETTEIVGEAGVAIEDEAARR